MRIKCHFGLIAQTRLINFLEKHQVKYILTELVNAKEKLCTFDLYEDQEVYEKFKRQFPFTSKYDAIKTVEYSKDEIEQAEWLTVRNIGTKVNWEYEEESFDETCSYRRPFIKEIYYRHSEQIGMLSASNSIKWGTRQFFSGPNSADDMIFCSEKTKELLGDCWQGLEFWNVKKYGKSKYIPDLYQLFFREHLPIETIQGNLVTCRHCGRKIIRLKSNIEQLKLCGQYLNDENKVYQTGSVLTDQLMEYTTYSLNIVPQKFYRFCEKNQMNRGMIYEPIVLV